jgi:hypothetical protein
VPVPVGAQRQDTTGPGKLSEIAADAINEEIWDLLPGYISHRMLQHGRPVTSETLRALVDEVMLPSLTRHLHQSCRPCAQAPDE